MGAEFAERFGSLQERAKLAVHGATEPVERPEPRDPLGPGARVLWRGKAAVVEEVLDQQLPSGAGTVRVARIRFGDGVVKWKFTHELS